MDFSFVRHVEHCASIADYKCQCSLLVFLEAELSFHFNSFCSQRKLFIRGEKACMFEHTSLDHCMNVGDHLASLHKL